MSMAKMMKRIIGSHMMFQRKHETVSQAAVEDTEVLEQVAFVYCELSIQRWPTWFLAQRVYNMVISNVHICVQAW